MIFFLPLGTGSTWEDNEIRYLLRSLEQNFKEEFDVIVYATKKPEWLSVWYLEYERYYPDKLLKQNKGVRNYENYFDVLNKVYQFVHSEYCPEQFCYIYDDILLLKEITSKNILNIPQCEYGVNMYANYCVTKQGRTTNQAYELCNAKFNFEHHAPMIYNRDKLKELFKKFPFQEMAVPYSLATLYFNVYPEEHIQSTLIDSKNYLAGFEGFTGGIYTYRQDTIQQIEEAVKDKTWVNYNDTGLFWHTDKYFPFQDWIIKQFPNKSQFENDI
jgi:hypothetical protein